LSFQYPHGSSFALNEKSIRLSASAFNSFHFNSYAVALGDIEFSQKTVQRKFRDRPRGKLPYGNGEMGHLVVVDQQLYAPIDRVPDAQQSPSGGHP